ncbi:hypothetical protein Dip510_001763 [Elusimicrobium posterum]|uniref:hypothetical protein n=1 Tax=Elusimicrobium posterum TaxID=3116653 RepID=UPI003C786537
MWKIFNLLVSKAGRSAAPYVATGAAVFGAAAGYGILNNYASNTTANEYAQARRAPAIVQQVQQGGAPEGQFGSAASARSGAPVASGSGVQMGSRAASGSAAGSPGATASTSASSVDVGSAQSGLYQGGGIGSGNASVDLNALGSGSSRSASGGNNYASSSAAAQTQIGSIQSGSGFQSSGGGKGSGSTYSNPAGSSANSSLYGAGGSDSASMLTGGNAYSKAGVGQSAKPGMVSMGSRDTFSTTGGGSGSAAGGGDNTFARAKGVQKHLAGADKNAAATVTQEGYLADGRAGSSIQTALGKFAAGSSGTMLDSGSIGSSAKGKDWKAIKDAQEKLRKKRENIVTILFIVTLALAISCAFLITKALNGLPAPWGHIVAIGLTTLAVGAWLTMFLLAKKYAGADDGAAISNKLYVWLSVIGGALVAAGIAVGWARAAHDKAAAQEQALDQTMSNMEQELGSKVADGSITDADLANHKELLSNTPKEQWGELNTSFAKEHGVTFNGDVHMSADGIFSNNQGLQFTENYLTGGDAFNPSHVFDPKTGGTAFTDVSGNIIPNTVTAPVNGMAQIPGQAVSQVTGEAVKQASGGFVKEVGKTMATTAAMSVASTGFEKVKDVTSGDADEKQALEEAEKIRK